MMNNACIKMQNRRMYLLFKLLVGTQVGQRKNFKQSFHFQKHQMSTFNMFQLSQCPITAWEVMIQSTIKVLENTHTKNSILKIKTAAKSHEYFIICQYKIEQPKKLRYLLLFFQRFHSYCVKQTYFSPMQHCYLLKL